jgi:hypothetical protein
MASTARSLSLYIVENQGFDYDAEMGSLIERGEALALEKTIRTGALKLLLKSSVVRGSGR